MIYELWQKDDDKSYCLLPVNSPGYEYLTSDSHKVTEFVADTFNDAIIQRDKFLQWC